MSKLNELFQKKLHVVNFGVEAFYDDLAAQGVPAVHVDWKPVAGGDKAAAGNLRKLKKPELAEKIEAANKEALRRILAAHPVQGADPQPVGTRAGVRLAGLPGLHLG